MVPRGSLNLNLNGQKDPQLRPVHTGHPMRIEPDQIWFERVHTECTFEQSGSDPD